MKNWISFLLLLPMCLSIMIGGVAENGHTYTAHDTGGNIKGNRIDVYFDDHDEAWDFGTQYAEVFVYAEED